LHKPGPGLPLDIVMKVKPIFEELKVMKTIYKSVCMVVHRTRMNCSMPLFIPRNKSKYASLSQLQFGVYDAVANFNIARKASILIFEKMGMIPGK